MSAAGRIAPIGHDCPRISAAFEGQFRGRDKHTNQHTHPHTTRPLAPAPVQASEPTNLSFLYGSIGIQAVAAAARYSDTKPSHAQAVHRIDQRFVESAV